MSTVKYSVVELSKLKRWPKLERHLNGKKVRIFSGEWMAWWKPNGCGYTSILSEAGIYDFDDAVRRSGHSGPEKRIKYVEVTQNCVWCGGDAHTSASCKAGPPNTIPESTQIPKEIIISLLAYLDDLPEDWGNYSGHWRCGYNQCRNKVAWLLDGRTPHKPIDNPPNPTDK